jgi:hypothetical protein
MEFRRRLVPTVALTGSVALAVPVIFAVAPGARAADGPPADGPAADGPTAEASVVDVENWQAPRRKIVHREFSPWSHPTPGQVQEIIRAEAHRWHIPAASLSRRVACESHYHWWASNGQYQGVLQFGASAFYRGLGTIRSRQVKLVRERVRRVHDARITRYSDGHSTRQRTTPRRQRVVSVYTGRLPRHPSMGNAWVQLRIGAQAIRGISAVSSSEWACGA